MPRALRRLVALIGLLTVVSMITFGAMNFLGDPLFNILGPVAADVDNPESLQAIEEAKAQYHLDKSLPERWSRWAWDFVRGDFGVQFSSSGQPPVSNLIKERLPRTLQLMAIAQLIAVGLAIPWSVLAASRANRRTDKVSTVTAFAFVLFDMKVVIPSMGSRDKKCFFRHPVMSFGFLDVIFGGKVLEIDTYEPPNFIW